MIAVIIPSYRVKRHILSVLSKISPKVGRIYIVDDVCPEQTGAYIQELLNSQELKDDRIRVIRHSENQGVGGAVLTGFKRAADEGAMIFVKLDGDGQMDPTFIPTLIHPIESGQADYCKGNRFFSPEGLSEMPLLRLIGNAGLSFLTKFTTGLWGVMDPTNGFVAIHAKVFEQLDTTKISRGYFFETDMLFRLALLGAVVKDVPMKARYGDETSNLKISRVLLVFPFKHFTRFLKRIIYQYFLRDFSIASVELVLGLASLIWAGVFGLSHYIHGQITGIRTGTGALAITTISFLFSIQLLLAFLSFDTRQGDKIPLHQLLEKK